MITVYYEFGWYPGNRIFGSYKDLTEWLEWKFKIAELTRKTFTITKIET